MKQSLRATFANFFFYSFYFATMFVPKDKHLWVFIGWHRGDAGEIFADNTKYLFLHASQMKNIRAVWLAKDETLAQELREKGFISYREKSVRGILAALRAHTTVVDAYLLGKNFMWSGGSRLVQLLHGKGFKKGGYTKAQFRDPDAICVPSSSVANLLPKSFIGKSILHVTGYPRTDVFKEVIEGAEIGVDPSLRTELSSLQSQNPKPHLLLYAPTYRRGQTEFDLRKMIPAAFEEWLSLKNAHLFVSLHPKYRLQKRPMDSDCIHYVQESDVYPLLTQFDILINDYSSLFADFLLLDRPIVFYPFDRSAYEIKEGFNVDYDAMTPGPKAMNATELMSCLEEMFKADTYAKMRAKIRDFYHAHPGGGAGERVMSALMTEV